MTGLDKMIFLNTVRSVFQLTPTSWIFIIVVNISVKFSGGDLSPVRGQTISVKCRSQGSVIVRGSKNKIINMLYPSPRFALFKTLSSCLMKLKGHGKALPRESMQLITNIFLSKTLSVHLSIYCICISLSLIP